jgi:hypothetical protein
MGALTLDRFRTLTLANPALQRQATIDKDMLTDWVNLAYFEVTGAVDFESLNRCAFINTVSTVSVYNMPVRFLGMISIQDRTTKGKLIRTGLRNLQRMTHDSTGYPRYWARKEGGVVLWPVPDAVYQLFAYYIAEPARLVNPTDVTVLPSTWDSSILMLTQSYGLLNFNEFEAADRLRATAFANLGSRMKDADFAEPMEGPLNVARSWADISNLRPDSERY